MRSKITPGVRQKTILYAPNGVGFNVHQCGFFLVPRRSHCETPRFFIQHPQPITPEELSAAYCHQVRLLTLEVLDELGLLYLPDGEYSVEYYYPIIYKNLSINGVPELYRENPLIFDEGVFRQTCDLVEQLELLTCKYPHHPPKDHY